MDDFIGSVVLSLSGRDNGDLFVVLTDDSDRFVFYADGRTRKIQSPKKKSKKHVRILGKSSVTDISAVTNKQLRRLLYDFKLSISCAPEKEE
jgi:hypothetical protein